MRLLAVLLLVLVLRVLVLMLLLLLLLLLMLLLVGVSRSMRRAVCGAIRGRRGALGCGGGGVRVRVLVCVLLVCVLLVCVRVRVWRVLVLVDGREAHRVHWGRARAGGGGEGVNVGDLVETVEATESRVVRRSGWWAVDDGQRSGGDVVGVEMRRMGATGQGRQAGRRAGQTGQGRQGRDGGAREDGMGRDVMGWDI